MTQKELKGLLHYDENTGVFRWVVNKNSRARKGGIAGTSHNAGYISITANYKRFLAHRLAWFYVHGVFPKEIDHINRDRMDNRLCNLRSVTRTENNLNRGDKTKNISGVIGVEWNKGKGKWHSRIKRNKKQSHIGYFDCLQEAIRARKLEELKYN